MNEKENDMNYSFINYNFGNNYCTTNIILFPIGDG